jgi:transposase
MATCALEKEMASRKQYTEEFKREAVRLATTPGNAMASVARDLGVNRSLIGHWVRNARAGLYDVEPGVPLKSDLHSENDALRRELAKVKMERDILKKALGYFAKDPM